MRTAKRKAALLLNKLPGVLTWFSLTLHGSAVRKTRVGQQEHCDSPIKDKHSCGRARVWKAMLCLANKFGRQFWTHCRACQLVDSSVLEHSEFSWLRICTSSLGISLFRSFEWHLWHVVWMSPASGHYNRCSAQTKATKANSQEEKENNNNDKTNDTKSVFGQTAAIAGVRYVSEQQLGSLSWRFRARKNEGIFSFTRTTQACAVWSGSE